MNEKIVEFKEKIKSKKVAAIGIGRTNTALIKYLSSCGAEVTAFDKKDAEAIGEYHELLKEMGCKFSLGENYLSNLNGFDYIFRTPGIRFDLPEIEKEVSRGAILSTELELFFELCPAEIFGITGSDGKTTTTTLTYLLLKEAGYKCWLGGNIGTPLIDKINEISSDDKVIIELSSFQLHTFKQSPKNAIITNITPNHLDYHKSMDEYIDAKKNIFKFQIKSDKIVLNYDNDITRSFEGEVKSDSIFFSRLVELDRGIFLKNNKIVYKDATITKDIIDISDIKIPGMHNVENYMAAIGITLGYVSYENIRAVATTFNGVEHRIELVRELNGVKFYNDSIATSPARTMAGLNSFSQKLILIAGGYDKKIPFDELGKAISDKVKYLVLVGKTSDKIESSVREYDIELPIYKCGTLEEAVNKAYELSVKGDIITLSPACASFDMYKNFEERGLAFKQIVNSLS